MKNISQTTLSLFLAMSLVHVATAGVISVSPALTDDASTGIDAAKTYTHTISGGTAATVNGVNFEALTDVITPANFDWNTNGFVKNQIGCCNNGDWNPAAGGVTGPEFINMLGSFTFSSNGDANPATQTFTLSGLTPTTIYNARLYVRVWDTEGSGRPVDITFTNGTEVDNTEPAPEDRPSLVLGGGNDHQAFYVDYEYTAQGTEMSIDVLVVGGVGSGSFHLYALSNEVNPIPEPSTLLLAAMALGGMLTCTRRRRRQRS